MTLQEALQEGFKYMSFSDSAAYLTEDTKGVFTWKFKSDNSVCQHQGFMVSHFTREDWFQFIPTLHTCEACRLRDEIELYAKQHPIHMRLTLGLIYLLQKECECKVETR